ncbi:DUF4123 domain-containing protein [Celerinatantimonas diazotrophica]|uniref:Uncharacterized protein DUF4123 n=1 Tax=Celerinatantimonas diazotrophica TaxID=412034 RepID=A0A4R1K7Q2_9GAMM|nr:DUF4123 domain-containing protein [Celerinatantimonas diazotrophica]TCK60070.1 uncharacterized protein DUF4123 [Celerinatantimonas diazotrophica]CAG9295117.1 hypothetical protein CEDIAZO_00229 [Celerinatantimonas diazotrophica]
MNTRQEHTEPEFNFWLMSHSTLLQVEPYIPREVFMEGGTMLFFDEPFAQLSEYSPWLIPWHSELSTLPEAILSLGIGIHSSYRFDELLDHFRSLLIAAYQGELMTFRFYDPQVLLPMLKGMSAQRQSQLLGPVATLSFFHEAQWLAFKNSESQSWQLKPRPWWRIEPSDTESLYSVDHHAYSLTRRLWQCSPELLVNVDDAQSELKNYLTSAINQGFDNDQRELWAIGQLAMQYDYSIDALANELHLNEQELRIINHDMER